MDRRRLFFSILMENLERHEISGKLLLPIAHTHAICLTLGVMERSTRNREFVSIILPDMGHHWYLFYSMAIKSVRRAERINGETCAYWLAGRCNRNPCRFLHGGVPVPSTTHHYATTAHHYSK